MMSEGDVVPRGPAPQGTSPTTLALNARMGLVQVLMTFAFNLVLIPFILHVAGASLYGSWIALLTVVAVGALADGGIRTEIARRVAKAHGQGDQDAVTRAAREGLTATTLVVVPLTTVMVLCTPAIVGALRAGGSAPTESQDMVLALRILVVVLCAQLLVGAYTAVSRGFQRQDIELTGQVLSMPVTAVAILVGLDQGWGLWALLAGQIAGIATSTVFQLVRQRQLIPHTPARLVRPSRALLAYVGLSGLALVTQIGDVVDTQWDKVVLAHFVGPEAVAAFHIGATLALQAKVVAVIPLAPLMVSVAELGGRSLDDAGRVHTRMARASAVLAAAVLGAMFVFGPALVELWLGSGHDDVGKVCRWFTVAVLINVLVAPAAIQAYGEGKHKLAALGAVSNMVVNVVASAVLATQIGLMGPVYGSILGNAAGAAVFTVAARPRLSHWEPPHLLALVPAVALGAAAMVSGVDTHAEPWVVLPAAAAFALLVLTMGSRLANVHLGELLCAGPSGRQP